MESNEMSSSKEDIALNIYSDFDQSQNKETMHKLHVQVNLNF